MSIQIELLHPNAYNLLRELAALNLIRLSSSKPQSSVDNILKFAGILSEEEASEWESAIKDTENIDHERF
ncbi:MAG: hypothetical protein AAGG68_10025 [Bacteroidota bacterium]